jgi:2-pyrone-4,6-dicarboxylate lactonase
MHESGWTDTHVHVFDPWRFPYSAPRKYTPPSATAPDLIRHLQRVGCERVVVIQPSVYGYDNRCLVQTVTELLSQGIQARGVAVLSPQTTRDELTIMHEAGIRAARINWQVPSGDNDQRRSLSEALSELDTLLLNMPWAIQVFARIEDILSAENVIGRIARPVVLDHFALISAKAVEPHFDLILLSRMLDNNEHLYVKLSAPYQISEAEPDHEDVGHLVQALVRSAPEQVLWGSNWPHTWGHKRTVENEGTAVESFRYQDDVHTLAQMRKWTKTPGAFERLMVGNPARLFGF